LLDFTFDLTLAIGGRTHKELMDELDIEELAYWYARSKRKPFDDPWIRSGVEIATSVNIWKSKGKKKIKGSDVYPHLKTKTTKTKSNIFALLNEAAKREEKSLRQKQVIPFV